MTSVLTKSFWRSMFGKSFWRSVMAFVVAMVLSLALVAVLLGLTGQPVLEVYGLLFTGTMGSVAGWQGALVYGTPIAFTALAALVAFKMLAWNIGGGGQLILGSLGAILMGLTFGHLPGPIPIVLVLIGGALFGGLWASICAVLKLWLGVSELLSTLMLNYVAVLLVAYLISGPMQDPAMHGWPYSRQIPPGAMIPSYGQTGVHAGVILAVIAALVIYVIFRSTKWGFQVRVIGSSRPAARYAGMAIGRKFLTVMFISGALAGLAGVGQVAGTGGRLIALGPELGYTGILVAWLSGLNPLATLFFALFYGLLLQGGTALQMTGTNPNLVLIVQATFVILTLVILTVVNRWRRVEEEEASPDEPEEASADEPEEASAESTLPKVARSDSSASGAGSVVM